MEKKINARKIFAAVSWILVIACMGAIFYLSHQNAEVSAELSEEAMGYLIAFLLRYIDHNTFRKIAHFTEYCGLAFLCYNAVRASRKVSGKQKKFSFAAPFLICFLYAVSDEIHQIFVPGRACRAFDVMVDCAGIITGLAVFYAVYRIAKSCAQRRAQKRGKRRREPKDARSGAPLIPND